MSNVSMINGHIDEPKGLTDEDVVKALECCTKPEVGKKCPRARGNNLCNDICVEFLLHDALGLVKRLKADKEALIKGQESLMKHLERKKEIITELDNEVERKTTECERLEIYMDELVKQRLNQAKSKAIKEFAERLKTNIDEGELYEKHYDYIITIEHIDNLVKEMER